MEEERRRRREGKKQKEIKSNWQPNIRAKPSRTHQNSRRRSENILFLLLFPRFFFYSFAFECLNSQSCFVFLRVLLALETQFVKLLLLPWQGNGRTKVEEYSHWLSIDFHGDHGYNENILVEGKILVFLFFPFLDWMFSYVNSNIMASHSGFMKRPCWAAAQGTRPLKRSSREYSLFFAIQASERAYVHSTENPIELWS